MMASASPLVDKVGHAIRKSIHDVTNLGYFRHLKERRKEVPQERVFLYSEKVGMVER